VAVVVLVELELRVTPVRLRQMVVLALQLVLRVSALIMLAEAVAQVGKLMESLIRLQIREPEDSGVAEMEQLVR
jgi:hypothetical protein